MQSHERRIPSLFTLTVIQLLLVVLLFVALLNRQRDLSLLTLLVLGILGGTRLWARGSLSGLKCKWALDKRKVFPGEKIVLTVSAENAKLLPVWIEIEIPVGNLILSPSNENALMKKTSLLWFERTKFEWNLIPKHRGVYQIGPLNLKGGDLYSFFSKQKQAAESHSIMVYPRRVPLKFFPLPRRDFFGAPKASSPVQDPIYILGTRDYQHRQPSKYIHWKASARHNHLQEKVFEPTLQEKILLAVDVASFADHQAQDEFERMLEVVASLAARLDRQGHSVGLVANGAVNGKESAIVPLDRDARQLASILEVLARLDMRPHLNLKDLLGQSLMNTWGAGCVYFSYQDGERVSWAMQYFSQSRIPASFVVSRRFLETGTSHAADRHNSYRMSDLVATGTD